MRRKGSEGPGSQEVTLSKDCTLEQTVGKEAKVTSRRPSATSRDRESSLQAQGEF